MWWIACSPLITVKARAAYLRILITYLTVFFVRLAMHIYLFLLCDYLKSGRPAIVYIFFDVWK